MSSPTARTLEECRKRGWTAGVVERWKPGFRDVPPAPPDPLLDAAHRLAMAVLQSDFYVENPDGHEAADAILEVYAGRRVVAAAPVKEQIPYGTRVDFLGFADLMVLDGLGGYLAIQACVGGDLQKRLQKALAVPELKDHLAQGNRFQVWGWRELKSSPTRQKWFPKIVSVVLRDGMLFHEEER